MSESERELASLREERGGAEVAAGVGGRGKGVERGEGKNCKRSLQRSLFAARGTNATECPPLSLRPAVA